MKGQERLKGLLARIVANAKLTERALDHTIFVGASGTGKTTTAMVMANECERRVFMIKAPVALDTFEQLSEVCRDGDCIIVDEIHLVANGDRRGATSSADPETWFSVMEDHRLATAHGIVTFPKVTFLGATTDAGLLPEPFLNRFPLRLRLDDYTVEQMAELGVENARRLDLGIDDDAALLFARACRRNPRQLNDYVRNARSLAARHITGAVAYEVVVDLNGTTLDGLTTPMQQMLKVLLRCERISKGQKVYTASVNTVATALGFSRDTKHVALFVEPELIRLGYVQVMPSGRALTQSGVDRARQLKESSCC
jgi:Holliday junction DNA helicase RuvB